MAVVVVRMGDRASSAAPGDVLVALGLGSCIGLALVDSGVGVAGLAHIVLPDSEGRADAPGRFADTAVDALLDSVVALGARRGRIEAVLVGGASMFSSGGALEVGARNEAAVRAALAQLRIPIAAAATGGSCGRTMRVWAGSGRVAARAAGQDEVELCAAGPVAA